MCVCVCVAIMHDLMSINRYHHAKEGTGRPSVLFIACLSFCGWKLDRIFIYPGRSSFLFFLFFFSFLVEWYFQLHRDYSMNWQQICEKMIEGVRFSDSLNLEIMPIILHILGHTMFHDNCLSLSQDTSIDFQI